MLRTKSKYQILTEGITPPLFHSVTHCKSTTHPPLTEVVQSTTQIVVCISFINSITTY